MSAAARIDTMEAESDMRISRSQVSFAFTRFRSYVGGAGVRRLNYSRNYRVAQARSQGIIVS